MTGASSMVINDNYEFRKSLSMALGTLTALKGQQLALFLIGIDMLVIPL